MAREVKKIQTITELQLLMPKLLREHSKDKKLMKAAISNPILALEKIGYTLSPKVKKEIEELARFNVKQRKKRIEITEKINKISGKKTDLSSKISLSNTLKSALPKKAFNIDKKSVEPKAIIKIAVEKREIQLFQKKSKKDPLSEFKNAHEIIPLLIEYRKTEALSPQFASKKTFAALLAGKKAKTGISISNVRFRIQKRSKRKANR